MENLKKFNLTGADYEYSDFLYEVCFGFFEPSQSEFVGTINTHSKQCQLVESSWEVKEMKTFKPPLENTRVDCAGLAGNLRIIHKHQPEIDFQRV